MGTPTLLMGMCTSTAIMENSRIFIFKKLEIDLTHDPATPLLNIYPRDMNTDQTSRLEQLRSREPKCAINQGIYYQVKGLKKCDNGILFSYKK